MRKPDVIYVVRVLHGTSPSFGKPNRAEHTTTYTSSNLELAVAECYIRNREVCEKGAKGSHYALSLSDSEQTDFPPVYVDSAGRLTFDKRKAQKRQHEASAWTYDVWGNARDGYTANDRYCQIRDRIVTARLVALNLGTCGRWNPTTNAIDYYPPNHAYCDSWQFDETEIRRMKREAGIGGSSAGIGDEFSRYYERANGYPTGEIIINREPENVQS